MDTTTANPAADHPAADHPRADHPWSDHPRADVGQALSRPVQDRMLAGVAVGIARYLRLDVTLVRIVLAVLAVAGGTGVPIYLAGWLLIPEEGRERSVAGEFIESRQARSL
ncbi:MAG TPA: PspC domain-containing protein [Streptosporangiaceae bacterium]|nr:PspC domain-containing protein [Streptosporangiaceae bacterium]